MQPRNQPLQGSTAPRMEPPHQSHVHDLPMQAPHADRLSDLLLQQYELDDRLMRAIAVVEAFFQGRHV